MADVQPFRGWRYDLAQVGNLSDVTAPPYDVIDEAQQKALYEQHPCNVVRLILNRTEPGDDGPEDRYTRAADFLRHWMSEGVLMQEQEAAFYVYHQEFEWEGQSYLRKGFLGRIRLEEFGKGQIYPHEQTMKGPKADRLALTKACRMNLSPVFGLYPQVTDQVDGALDRAIAQLTPMVATDEHGVVHRIWPVTDPTAISQVTTALQQIPIFIADGHHRYETALNYRNELREAGELDEEFGAANFVLMHFVGMEDPGLAILPTHRLITGLAAPLSAAQIQEALAANFETQIVGTGPEAARETWEMMEMDGGQNVFGICSAADQQWIFARLTDDSPMQELAAEHSETWRTLGVAVLHRLIIDHLLGQFAADEQLKWRYVHLMDEVNDSLASGECQVACLVAPAGIEHVREIASAFEKMPPKSTFFYPKLLSGLVFHPLS